MQNYEGYTLNSEMACGITNPVCRSVSDCEQCALSAHYTTLFVSEYKLGHALPRFRLRNQSSARTWCKLFLHRAVRWSSECSLTYFIFYVVLVADDHNFLFS